MAKVSRLIVQVWSGLLAVIFLAVSILGIIAIVLVPKFRGIGVGILVFGIVGLAVAIAGVLGAGFEKSEGEEKTTKTKIKATLLVLFFAIMSILHVLFMIFGVALICVRTSVKMLVTLEHADWEKLYGALPDKFKGGYDVAISKIQSFVIGLGVVMIVISVIILITCIAAAYQMGKELFAQFFMAAFAIIEIIIGFTLAIFLLIMNAGHNTVFFGNEIGKNIIVPIVIFGFVLAVVGFIGFVAIFIGNKYKVISVIFNVGNIIVLIAFLVLFILCIVFHALILGWADGLCEVSDGVDPCNVTVTKANSNMCPNAESPCYDDAELKKDVGAMMQSFMSILLFVCLYLVLFLLFVVISTCINCFRHPDAAETEETRPLFSFY